MEVVSTQSASGETINHTKESEMRIARPKRLHSGRWGAWVPGGDVKPGMLVRVIARYGKSFYCRIESVHWQGSTGAICKTTIINEWDESDLKIAFLNQLRPNNKKDGLHLDRVRRLVYDYVEDADGPAPFIEHYEYHEDYEIDCELYEFHAQGTVEDLTHSLLSPDPQTTQNDSNKVNNGEIITPGEEGVVEENQGSVGKRALSMKDKAVSTPIIIGSGNLVHLDSNKICKSCGAFLSPGQKGSASGYCGNCMH